MLAHALPRNKELHERLPDAVPGVQPPLFNQMASLAQQYVCAFLLQFAAICGLM
jgi:hypothetical protein